MLRGGSDRLDHLARAGDEARARLELRGHVGADPRRDRAQPLDLAHGQAQDRGGVGAAAAEARGHRDPLLAPRSAAAVRPSPRSRSAASARALRSGSSTPSQITSSASASDTAQLVGQLERLEHRADLVQAVVAASARRRGRG